MTDLITLYQLIIAALGNWWLSGLATGWLTRYRDDWAYWTLRIILFIALCGIYCLATGVQNWLYITNFMGGIL